MANWNLDNGYHLDSESTAVLTGELSFSIDQEYKNSPFRDLELTMKCIFEIDVVHSLPIDLWPLIPEKFRNDDTDLILETYIKECNIQVGAVHSKTEDIVKLLGPNSVGSVKYMRQLGALIGVVFPPEDESTLAETRKVLSQAIDWYKLKGSYQSASIVSMVLSSTINLYDMYTNDYVNFILTDWFVGEENENPPGLDATYYKSPHFGLEVVLNQIFTVGSLNYLWYRDYYNNLIKQIEEARPVHTVPHYLILLNPKTDEQGHVITVDGQIKTKVTSNWQFGAKYFDATGSSDAWSFDGGVMSFDTDLTSYIKSITKWVLGVGNYPASLDSSVVDVQVPVLTGTIAADDIVIYDDRFEFEFIVPKSTVQHGISELGLYVPGASDSLVLLSAFPKIDKVDNTELRIIVSVYKDDLSV